MAFYEVLVGNIGAVHKGTSKPQALKVYTEYVKQSKAGRGRAGGEDVTLWKDGEIIKEHYGTSSESNPTKFPKGKFIPVEAVRYNANGSVTVKVKDSVMRRNPTLRQNIAAGFTNATGFHPIRSSYDYDPERASDEYGDYGSGVRKAVKRRKPAAKKRKPAAKKRAAPKRKATKKRKR